MAEDLQRMRAEYERRQSSEAHRWNYSALNPVFLFFKTQRQRNILKLLSKDKVASLRSKRILEVGCGSGSVLQEFSTLGAKPENLSGVDLLHHRLCGGKEHLSSRNFSCADGRHLPYQQHTFDIVMQFTALSSILDRQIRMDVASEMLRVLKPGGLIIWYDFIYNPTNPQTTGIGKKEIIQSFPDCSFHFQRVTLAPPLARQVVPVSWTAATFLESITLFNSHYLVGIRKIDSQKAGQTIG